MANELAGQLYRKGIAIFLCSSSRMKNLDPLEGYAIKAHSHLQKSKNRVYYPYCFLCGLYYLLPTTNHSLFLWPILNSAKTSSSSVALLARVPTITRVKTKSLLSERLNSQSTAKTATSTRRTRRLRNSTWLIAYSLWLIADSANLCHSDSRILTSGMEL
jgi:hypothetical protein